MPPLVAIAHDSASLTLLTLVLASAACGASGPPPAPAETVVRPALRLEWRAEQADGDLVLVTIVVEGKSISLGTLAAGTETEHGSPRTCAVRAAHPLRTEFACGEMSAYYTAELQGEELVLGLLDGKSPRELQRMPVYADGLAVKPYAMPD
jgi:hypothetical protein